MSMAASRWSDKDGREEITKEEIAAVYPTVAKTIADALGCDVDEVKLDVPLIEGLDAESIDFLDLVFRLERAFSVKIPRGKIVEDARGDLPEAEFEQKGLVTDVGLKRLREFLSEVPADRFQSPMKSRRHSAPVHAGDLLQGGRARAARRAGRGLTGGGEGADAMAERFSAFSFVDRITTLEPGQARAGTLRDPRRICRAFPSCLVAEAIGQLAAWVAMAHLGFRRRPVAGLAGETLFFGSVTPGQILDLAVELETCDEDAVAYGGSARVDGGVGARAPALRRADAADGGVRCAGSGARAISRLLCGPGAPAARIRGAAASTK